MRLKPRDIEINPNLPNYPFDNDLLDRKEEIENLTQIIQNVEDPLVLSINSPWGTGKTTFIELWCKYLEQQGQKTLYFNAWETDFAEDPLIVLVSKLDKWVSDNAKSKNETWNKFKKDIFPKILERSLIAGIKAATFKLMDMDKEYEKIFADLSGEITGDLIDKFNQKSQAITQFKDIIKELLDILPKQHKNLIIFIDELDRCRPTYAIELLERIKHLFNIERLVFILSTDTEQLSHSICAIYGNNFNSKRYLNRFIDLDYSLKVPDYKKYIESQFTNLFIDDFYQKRRNGGDQKNDLINFTLFMVNTFDFKLRDINLLTTRVKLVLLSIPDNSFILAPILITLLTLRYYNERLYREYKHNPILLEQVIGFIFRELEKSRNKYIGFSVVILIDIISYLIIFADDAEKEPKLITQYESSITSHRKNNSSYPNYQQTADTQAISNRINEIRAGLRWGNSSGQNFRKIVFEQIELSHQFNIN